MKVPLHAMNENLYRTAWTRALQEAEMIMGQYKVMERGRPNKADLTSKIFFDLLARDRDSINNAIILSGLSRLSYGQGPALPVVKTQAQLIEEQIEALKLQLQSGTLQ